jgi:glyoxylase-like metal-dependent hydrolase (beta-lactamase superfamily II)
VEARRPDLTDLDLGTPAGRDKTRRFRHRVRLLRPPSATPEQIDIMSLRPTLPALALIALSACGGGEPTPEPQAESAPAAATTPPAADVVRTADPAVRGYADSEFPRVQELAPGVYSYEQLTTFGQDRLTTVSFFVVTSEGVLVADGQGSAAETERLVARISEISEQPIRYVVVGSHHPDHAGGNSAFPSGATFLAHPTSIARLREQGGAPAAVEAVDDERTITLGGREIRVLHLGRAHTGGDLVVYLPAERVLFMGEVFMNRVFPSMGEAFPTEWVQAIERAQAMDVAVFVPGHGFVDMPTVLAEELEAFQEAIRVVIAQVEGVHDEGAAVDEALGRANFGDAATWSRAASLREAAIRRVYADLNGELGTP